MAFNNNYSIQISAQVALIQVRANNILSLVEALFKNLKVGNSKNANNLLILLLQLSRWDYDAHQQRKIQKKKDLAVESRIKGRGKREDFQFLLFCDVDFFQTVLSFSGHRNYENKNVFNCYVLESFISKQIKTY